MSKFSGFFNGIGGKLQALSTVRKVVTALVTATTLAVGGGAVVVSSVGSGSADVANTEMSSDTETMEYIEETETESETETETETTEERDITVTIKSTTIFEDLKIKIVDETGNLVKGFPFEVVVTPINGEEGDERTPIEFNDHDKDGIMHLKEMKGGDYIIDLKELEGIIISKNSVKAVVKGELEYEKVDNKDEIKKDDASQDTAENNVVVEAVLQDTLPLLESKLYSVEVAKDKVNFSNFPGASVSKENTEATLNKTEKVNAIDAVEVSILSVERYTVMSANVLGNNMSEFSTSAAIEAIAEDDGDNLSPFTEGEQGGNNSEETTSAELPTTSTEPPTTSTEPPTTSTESPTTSTEPPMTSTETPTTSTETPSTDQTQSGAGSTSGEGDSSNGSTDSSSSNGSSESTEGSSEEGSSEPSKENIVASAKIKLPKAVTLYHYGNDNSKKAKISLDITDKDGIIVADGIKWSISSADVVDLKVAEDKKSADLVVKKAGTATIVVEVKYVSGVDGKTSTTQLSSTVTVGNHTDNTTHLKDASGQLLYIDKDAKNKATPANYATASKLYTTPKYTGWQTLNGKLYYFKADGTPATGGQVIGGVQYNFNSDGSLIPSAETYGIDVSKWQANIDWKAVAQSGVKFAIIRCAYRGAKDGLIHEDPYFKANIKGATQNGIKVGVYFFSQAINEVEAIEEASMSIGLVQGYYLHFPIFIDTEKATNGRANSLDRATRTKVVRAFCETVRNSGYKAGIYASKSWYNNNLDMSQLSSYNIWVAQYNTSCTYTGRYDMWQYTDSGSVPGIKGSVDMNKCYTNY